LHVERTSLKEQQCEEISNKLVFSTFKRQVQHCSWPNHNCHCEIALVNAALNVQNFGAKLILKGFAPLQGKKCWRHLTPLKSNKKSQKISPPSLPYLSPAPLNTNP